MTATHIELHRKFVEYQADDTPEALAQRSYLLGFSEREQGETWSVLMKHRLVVILGEPGSGKTSELRAQQERQSENSFFLELNRLVTEEVSSILDDEGNHRLGEWKKERGEATFFLDAVDESKIQRTDDFFTALDRVKKAIGPAMPRARFVISSRISAWRPETDRAEVMRRFQIDPVISKVEGAVTSEASFSQPTSGNTEVTQEHNTEKIFVVTLLSLTPAQIETYSMEKGIADTPAFMAALERNNAWAFAGRPLDVDLLHVYWSAKGQLGNLTDLSEYMIGQLLNEVPNRSNRDILSPEVARTGAEFLAAASVFCRKLNFCIPNMHESASANTLATGDVLPESWLPKERLSLLDRPLFDAACHGAMTFHHRYHSDYLAAAWIVRLMNGTCTLAALEDLLFATVNGERVMRPSLKPVAAWLITCENVPWRGTLAEWILDTCPEIHLVHGDPAALPIAYRRMVLAKLIERYQGRNLVRLDLDHPALARFANAGLSDEISRYLRDNTIAEDLRIDLLLVVRAGRLLACIPAALEIFADLTSTDNFRSYVATVIRDVGDDGHRRQLANLWQTLPDISNTHLARLCEALFPQAIGVNGLIALLSRSGEVHEHSIDLPYYLATLLKQTLDARNARELLSGVLTLLSRPPLMQEPPLSKHFGWTISLIPVCLQFLLSNPELSDEDQKLVVSAVFVLEQADSLIDQYRLQTDARKEISIQQLLSHHATLRRKIFWVRVARYRNKHGKEPLPYILSGGYGAEIKLAQIDIDWLLKDVKGDLPFADRRLALSVAADLLWKSPLLQAVWWLLPHIRGDAELVAIWRQYVWARLRAPLMRVWFSHFRHKLLARYWWRNKLDRIRHQYWKTRDRWWLWRHLGDLRKGKYPYALANLARLAGKDNSSQYGGSDWRQVEREWGKAISDAARQGCMVGWRQFSPPLPHEKSERNSVDNRLFVGLAGLQTLWRAGKLDFEECSANEVDSLVRYACNELNGLPEWFPSLLAARPNDARKTLLVAAAGEWRYPASIEHVHDVVAKLAWISDLNPELVRVVMSQLQMEDPNHPSILDHALTIVLRSGEQGLEELLGIAKTRVGIYTTTQPQWFSWIKVWLQLDALPALDYLESVLPESSDQADDLIIRLCGSLSGRYGDEPQFNNPTSYLKLNALARLIPLVHRHVRVSDDIDRANGGAYRPGPRDHAQRLRSRLLEVLSGSKEAAAEDVMRGLLSEPNLAVERDWLLHLLDERKYLLVDDAPWEAGDVRKFAQEYRSEPRSDYQLFRLVVRLLVDIRNQVERSENAANRLPLRSGDLEKDFRGYLHQQLIERSLNWFSITQETEVDLGQRPDLRIERTGLNAQPVEIKLANLGWTVKTLTERLENQLLGQYLRPSNIRYGIYVLGNTDANRHWEVPGTGRRINFHELVELLQERAKVLQSEQRANADGIEVIGIDFSDPR
jgi:predicted DCC family thiol-disulfide oxidoreductase YuxK